MYISITWCDQISNKQVEESETLDARVTEVERSLEWQTRELKCHDEKRGNKLAGWCDRSIWIGSLAKSKDQLSKTSRMSPSPNFGIKGEEVALPFS